MKIIVRLALSILLVFIMYYLLFTRDGSIRLGLLLAGFNPLIRYENIDYENGVSYLNPIEIDDHIVYLECKNYGLLKVASYVVL